MAAFADLGYGVVDYVDADPQRPHLILRHDVDVSLEHALAMARCEADLSLRSTYFVLLRSPLYNPMDGRSEAILREIQALGHAVGLHFDATLYPDADILSSAVEKECAILESLIDAPVSVVSFHRPARHLFDYKDTLGGRIHAYQPRYFTEMGYCSDSRGAWYHGAPLDHPVIAAKKAMQLVTHPIWWDATPGHTVQQKLTQLVARRDRAYREALAENITPYRELLHDDNNRI